MSIKIITLLALATLPNFAKADLYKFKTTSGATEYQSAPCANNKHTQQSVIHTKQSNNSASDNDNKKMSMDFDNIDLSEALSVVADFSGNQLQFSKKIKPSNIQLHFKRCRMAGFIN